MTENFKPKNFFQRPEGKLGTAVLIGGAALVALKFNDIVSYITNALSSMGGTIALFAIAGAIAFALTDSRARNLLWYAYKGIMRKITSIFVQLDPIKILESYIEYLYKNLQEMNTHITKLRGQLTKLNSIVAQNTSEMQQTLRIAQQAKKQGNNELIAVNTRQYGRLKELNTKYQNLIEKIQVVYRVLTKIHTNSTYMIKDTENEVRMRKQEQEAIMSGYSAMKHAMNIINGDTDKKLMFDMANEALANDISYKIGEMDRFIELSGSFIDSVDLQNAAFEQEGLELIEKMEREGFSFLNQPYNATTNKQIDNNSVKDYNLSELDKALQDLEKTKNNSTNH